MANKHIRLQIRGGDTINDSSILLKDELGYKDGILKVGDGKSSWAKLRGISSGSDIIIDKTLSPTSENPVQNKAIFDKFKELEDALYKPIDIMSFTISPSIKEKGSTVTNVTLSWKTNKTPTKLILDGVEESVSDTSKVLTGLSLTMNTNKSYPLIVIDEKDVTDTASVSINFYNGVYYGVATEPTSYDSSFILGLVNPTTGEGRSLQGSKTKTFTVTANANQYIYYCLPSNGYGTPNFNVGGFDGGFSKVATIKPFKNASGYEEDYDIYRSDNANLGYTTVKVS